MATMMRAGVPLVQSFEIVADGVDKPKLRDLVLQIRSDVSSGNTFASPGTYYGSPITTGNWAQVGGS
jgi:type II secretory pathway component PulF